MLSRALFSCIRISHTGLEKFTKSTQSPTNIRAASHPLHTTTFSRLRPSNTVQNVRLPGGHQVPTMARSTHTRPLLDLFSSLFFTSKETQQKITQAQYIKLGNEEVYVDECKIKARADGEIKLYTTGLVYCTGLLMIGSKEVGMAHIHSQGIEFMKNMFDAIQPHQLIIYASNGVSEHSLGTNFYATMMGNLESLKNYAKQSGTHCEITDFEYSTKMIAPGHGLFFHFSDGEKEQFFTLNSKEMKKLNQY